ncbi:CDP-glucose 4,6-dehydratase [Chitinophaga sp. YR627]|uniref:CDP-glucose 4,6-dehydratase n=1 Tax=Chitinophaga sp. YR627 TaxID=1881041 RepID=UPI0008E69441|nr:CDP-glucose 4,6-dehydratase [Chitinophaga sp. YR627]SFN91736.1 CDP-glucose 4,6-dehydratase [Chitinophaga sp. YR627]
MSLLNAYKGRKVLLTGHTGFKGSWMAIWLKELGAEVYGYSLEPYSSYDNFVRCNLQDEIGHKIGDVRDRDAMIAYFNAVQPEIVFHLAAQPLVIKSYEDPAGTFETNLMGVVNFFDAVRLTPSVKVALNITSDKCYDNKEWIWGYRETDPMGGKDPYSASKGCAELITSSYMHSFFQKEGAALVASARAGNVIGGGDWAENRIVPDFFRAISAKETLNVRNLYATRPWQHVLEPLSGYLTLAVKLLTEGRQYCGGWNFGPDGMTNYSVKDLLDKVIDTHKAGAYVSTASPDQLHEAMLLKLDISKAVNFLKWKPVLTFEETVDFVVDGYKADMSETNNVLNSRREQIAAFTKLAAERQIQWAVQTEVLI